MTIRIEPHQSHGGTPADPQSFGSLLRCISLCNIRVEVDRGGTLVVSGTDSALDAQTQRGLRRFSGALRRIYDC